MITVNVEGLGQLNFPDGTDPQVIQATVKKQLGITEQAAPQDLPPNVGEEGQLTDPDTLKPRSILHELQRQAGRTARIGMEGVAALPLMAIDAGISARNLLTGENRELPSAQFQQSLDEVGLPRPEGFIEKGVDIAGQIITGSKTVPTVGIAKQAPARMVTPKTPKDPIGVDKALKTATPKVEELKTTARGIYKELDGLGVSLQPKAYNGLLNKISVQAKKQGLDADLTPKAKTVLDRLSEFKGRSPTLTEVDTLRKKAGIAAKSQEPAEAALGVMMKNTIDDFLNDINPTALKRANDKVSAEVGKKFKQARDLWGRARKSEMIEEAMEKARLQDSGFENGIRVQFRQILNNKKKRKAFNQEELTAMKKVVVGTKKENLARLLGKLGFSEGRATQLIGGSLGVAAGATVGGAPGAVAVPLIGQLSKSLARRMTAGNARIADQVIKAGKDAKKITSAYLRNTPRNQRDPEHLKELLMRPFVDKKTLPIPEKTPAAIDKYIAAVIATQND